MLRHVHICMCVGLRTHLDTQIPAVGSLLTEGCPHTSPADFHRTLCAHCRAHLSFLIICVAIAERIGTQLAMFPHSQTRRHGSQLLTTVRTSPKEGPLQGRDCVLVVFGSLVPSMGPGTR